MSKFIVEMTVTAISEHTKTVVIEAADEDEADDLAAELAGSTDFGDVHPDDGWRLIDFDFDVDAFVESPRTPGSAEESFNITL